MRFLRVREKLSRLARLELGLASFPPGLPSNFTDVVFTHGVVLTKEAHHAPHPQCKTRKAANS